MRAAYRPPVPARLRLVVALAVLCLSSACALSDQPYRQLALNQGLRHDGWLIGIEQAYREDIGAPGPGKIDSDHFKEERLPWIEDEIRELRKKPGYARSAFDRRRIQEQDTVLLRNEIFRKYANDKKIPIVTQVYEAFKPVAIETDRYVSVDLFNAHDRDGSGVIGETKFLYDESFAALELFRRRYRAKLAEGKYTHVVLLALGWHVDQIEAAHIYNLMIRNIKAHADGEFRPLVVGLTWPSAWLQGLIQPLDLIGHVFSYFDKSQDADSIGATLAAHLLHNILLAESGSVPVVAIGHSLGARMLSRAYFSGRHLAANKSRQKLDLLVCLQGAFSANRFLESDPDEGHPYSHFADMRAKIVLTSSSFDLANAAARFLTTFPNVGGDYGLNVAADEPETFRIVTWPGSRHPDSLPDRDILFPDGERRILMINAEQIVKGGTGGLYGKKVGPHNDYVDQEMAQLLWTLIRCACEEKAGRPAAHE